MKSQKSQPPRPELRIRHVEGHGWTWCYVEADDDVELYSNELYDTAEEAEEWGRRAYPDLRFASRSPTLGFQSEDEP